MLVLALVGAGAMSMLAAGCYDGKKVRPPDTSVPDGGPDARPDADAPGADGGVALDTFLEQVAKATCAWQFRCCSLPEIDTIGQSSYLTESECVSQSIIQLRVLLAAERSALVEGRLTLDAGRIGACVQQLTARACTSAFQRDATPIGLGGLLGACEDPFVGQTPVGARCTNLRECVAGSVCSHFGDTIGLHAVDVAHRSASFPLGMPASAQGICVFDQKEGQRCAMSQQCQVGLYCRRTDFVCAVPAREGDACVSVEPDTEAPDGPPIVCGTNAAPSICVADVCRRLPREGEPCLSSSDIIDPGVAVPPCDPASPLDLVCVGSELGGDGVCKKAAGRGATCGGFGIPPCSVSLQCELVDGGDLGTCQDLPGPGEPCLSFSCRAPAVCYTGTMTCVVPPSSARYGAKCQTDLDCASLFCASRFIGEESKVCVHSMDAVGCIGAGASPAVSNTPPPMPL